MVLRLIPLFDYQFTFDELSGLDRTHFNSFSELIKKGVKIDTHPAFVQILIYYLTKLFGYSTWVIKLPFLLFSFGTIIYAYLFSLKHFSKQAAIFSSVIFSFSLLFVFHAPIARMYTSGIFFCVALLFYFFKIFFLNENKSSNYFFFGLFALLSALNQHINALFAFTVCVSGLFFLNKSNAKTYLIACLLTVVCYLPHLPVTLAQLSVGGIGYEQGGWLPKPVFTDIFIFLKTLFGTGKTYLVFLFFLALAFIDTKKIALDKKQIFLLIIFLINYLIIFFYSLWRAPVFQHSVMLFSATALIFFICSLLQFKNRYFFYSALLSLSFVLIYKSYMKKDYFHQCVETIFEYQFERTDHYKQLYGEASVYPIFFDADQTMKKIYFNKYKPFDCKITADAETKSMNAFSHFISRLKCDYLVLASSMPAQQALAKSYFPYLIENTQTQAVNYKVYSKRAADKNKVVSDDAILRISDLKQPESFNYRKLNSESFKNGLLALVVDSLTEFPFDASADYNSIISREGQEILLTAVFKVKHPESTRIASCIAVNDLQSNASYMYNSKETSDFVMQADSTVTVYSDNFFGTAHRQAKINSRIGCYIWNKEKENFKLTGFEIKVIDYWPMKWRFWD